MIRGLDVRTGVLPRTHGSALFTRGETQALVTATLGTARDAQVLYERMANVPIPSCSTTTSLRTP